MDKIQEPNLIWQNLCVFGLPWISFLFGVIVPSYYNEKKKNSGANPDRSFFLKCVLIGFLACIPIVSSFIGILRSCFQSDGLAFLFAIGLIVEQGCLVREKVLHSYFE